MHVYMCASVYVRLCACERTYGFACVCTRACRLSLCATLVHVPLLRASPDVCLEDGLIHVTLRWREAPIHGPCARHVTHVAVQLAARVHEHEHALPQHLRSTAWRGGAPAALA